MMEQLNLHEREIVYYFDTFEAYDTEKRGRIRMDDAGKLFLQSGLPMNTLNKIVELCGADRLGYYGRSQFFTALKLISLAQSGSEVSLEALNMIDRNFPLPNFDLTNISLSEESELSNHVVFSKSTDRGKAHLTSYNLQDKTFGTLPDMFTDVSTHDPPDLNPHIPTGWTQFGDGVLEELPVANVDLDPGDLEEERGLLTNELVERPNELSFYRVSKDHSVPPKDPFIISPLIKSNDECINPHAFTSSTSYSLSPNTTPSPTTRSRGSPRNSPPFYPLQDEDDPAKHSSDHWAYQQLEDTTSIRTYAMTMKPSMSNTRPEDVLNNLSRVAPHCEIKSMLLHTDEMDRLTHVQRSKSNEEPSLLGFRSPDRCYDVSNSEPVSPKKVDCRWFSLFNIHSKQQAQYADLFEQVLDARQNDGHRSPVLQSEVRTLFLSQFRITLSMFEKIWRLADMDRDNRLNKPEFCLAAHLAHLHGHQGLSIEEAISATTSYIADHLQRDLYHSLRTVPLYQPDHHQPILSNPNQTVSDSSFNCVVPNDSAQPHSDAFVRIQSSNTFSLQISPVNLIDKPNQNHHSKFHNQDSLEPKAHADGEDASDEEVDGGVVEPDETALLPNMALNDKPRLRPTRSKLRSSPHSDSNTSLRLSSSAEQSSSSDADSVVGSSSAEEETRSSSSRSSSSSSSTEGTTTTTTSASTSSTVSNSGDDSHNHKSRRKKKTVLDPDYMLANGKANARKGKHRRVDSIQLLAVTTGRRPSKLAQYSVGRRRRLLAALIREAKSVNHTLLRLNNEMQGEWNELNDQRVNLSAQLRHLGLQPPS